MSPMPSDKQRLRLLLDRELADAPRVEPRCPHADRCGGCAFQHIPYDHQAEAKRRACRSLLADVLPGARDGDGIEVGLVRSPRTYAYRQRMDFVFAFRKAGLRRRGNHREVVELTACPLLGEPGFSTFRRARALAEAAGLASYDYLRFRGELRYFVVRRNRAGQILLSLVTKNDSPEVAAAVDRVAAALLAEGRVVGVHWLHAPGMGDVSFGKPLANRGAPYLVEHLNGRAFAIGPNTFFQANPWVAAAAYARLAESAAGARLAWDLYSGTGVIALHVVGEVPAVVAVENDPDNLALAEINSRAAGAAGGRVGMRAGDAAVFLREAVRAPSGGIPDWVAVNPPRAGLGTPGAEALAALSPRRIAYLSCNPGSLARDLAVLGVGTRYALREATVFDMFPQTPHFETLAILDREGTT